MCCSSCGVHSIYPLPAATDLPRFYPNQYANYGKSASRLTELLVSMYERSYRREIARLTPAGGHVLDVGCSCGHYLDIISKGTSLQVSGTELSDEAAAPARAKGYTVHVGEFENIKLPQNHYDVIRMSHLIEHVINPETTLRAAYNALKPGGHLLLETPNTGALDCRIFGRYWGALHYPRHLHLFNVGQLARLITATGFSPPLATGTMMSTGWAMGIQNYLVSRHNIVLKNGRAAFYPLLLLLFVPVLFLQNLTGNATMVKYVAAKPA